MSIITFLCGNCRGEATVPESVGCWVKPQSRNGPVFSFRGPKHPTIDTATILGVWVENGRLCSWAR